MKSIFEFLKEYLYWFLLGAMMAGGAYLGLFGGAITLLSRSLSNIYQVVGQTQGAVLFGCVGVFLYLGFISIFRK